MIWQVKEWESESGWHCKCVDDLANNSAAWWLPARVLGISPAEFIKLLLTKYKPDDFYFIYIFIKIIMYLYFIYKRIYIFKIFILL